MMDDLALRFREPLSRFFARRVASVEVEDLVSDVFVRLLRHQKSIAEIDYIERYVFKVAWDVLRDKHRRLSIRAIEVHENLADIAEEAAFPPDRILIGREMVERLSAVIEELPGKTRTIFLLYHFEGVPQVEIARSLVISLSSVEKHMASANAKILRKLGPLP